MRTVISISLPPKLIRLVKEEMKDGQYATTSEFFRDLLRAWQEERQLAELHASQKEIADGKGKVLRNLDDLD